jgi:hypothetical protein
MHHKKFVALRRGHESDGNPAQHEYIYEVDGQRISVEVHPAVMNRWNVSLPDIKQAIEILIETRLGKRRSQGESNHLLLNEVCAMPIAQKLGWRAARR